jgi:hypothetical protein
MKETIGGILIAIGILVAGANGLCALVALFDDAPDPEGIGEAMIVIGGFFFVIGVAIVFWGRALIRSARKQRDIGGKEG